MALEQLIWHGVDAGGWHGHWHWHCVKSRLDVDQSIQSVQSIIQSINSVSSEVRQGTEGVSTRVWEGTGTTGEQEQEQEEEEGLEGASDRVVA